jgi:hypothetical protein
MAPLLIKLKLQAGLSYWGAGRGPLRGLEDTLAFLHNL